MYNANTASTCTCTCIMYWHNNFSTAGPLFMLLHMHMFIRLIVALPNILGFDSAS